MELGLSKFRIHTKRNRIGEATRGTRNIGNDEGRRRRKPDSVSRFLRDKKEEPELTKFRIRGTKRNRTHHTRRTSSKARWSAGTEHRRREKRRYAKAGGSRFGIQV